MRCDPRPRGRCRTIVGTLSTSLMLLSGCGGGGGPAPGSQASYTIAGSLSGLQSGQSVVLQDNGGDSTTVSANGAFTFSNPAASGSSYSVTVAAQPSGQTCAVSGGSGTVASADITAISVTCVSNPTLAMIAGTSTGPGNNDGSLTVSRFNDPFGVAIDASGNTFVADSESDTVRKITAEGIVSTFAGAPGQPGSADGAGAAARFSAPAGIVSDSAGNLFVSDSGNNTIREVTPTGVVTTIAGTPGVTGSADGVGASAQFDHPTGITIDASGNLYVVDSWNDTVRRITPAGVVSTVVGVAGKTGFTSGALPGVLDADLGGVAISGSTLYISTYAGIAAVTHLP